MDTKLVNNIEEMKDFAVFYMKSLSKKRNNAQILILKGNLGSGKTTFTQQVAKFFEIEEYLTSPTFVIQKRYKIKNDQELGFENLIHIDAYRLESGKELIDLDWRQDISNSKNIIFKQGPERVVDVLPKDIKEISFKFIDEKVREITF